jgi:hypothetical protein
MNRDLSVSGTLAVGTSDGGTITDLELMLLLQVDAEQPWFYNTPDEMHQPVSNRNHVRLLIQSVDDDLPWVTFESADESTFAQVGDEIGGVIVEVNSVPGWIQRVGRVGPGDGAPVARSLSDNDIPASELHTKMEAITLCLAWMERRQIPEGYCLHDFVDLGQDQEEVSD